MSFSRLFGIRDLKYIQPMEDKIRTIRKYSVLWWVMMKRAAQTAFASRLGGLVFTGSKLLRFSLFLAFLILLVTKTNRIAGYSLWQVVFFFATFNLIDSITQFFFREVYRFRVYVVKGYFDYILTMPVSPLFRSLFGGSDVLDIPIVALTLVFLIVAAVGMGGVSVFGLLLYMILLLNAFLIALAIHICVLSMGVLTTEVDNTILLYRDLTQMGRIPIDIYREPIRGFLTFVIPVGVMMTFPAKALMGLLSFQFIMISLLIGGVVFFLSLQFWKFALRRYSSVSS